MPVIANMEHSPEHVEPVLHVRVHHDTGHIFPMCREQLEEMTSHMILQYVDDVVSRVTNSLREEVTRAVTNALPTRCDIELDDARHEAFRPWYLPDWADRLENPAEREHRGLRLQQVEAQRHQEEALREYERVRERERLLRIDLEMIQAAVGVMGGGYIREGIAGRSLSNVMPNKEKFFKWMKGMQKEYKVGEVSASLIDSNLKVWEEANKLKHCLFTDYLQRIKDGKYLVFHVTPPKSICKSGITLGFKRDRDNSWKFDQAKGKCNSTQSDPRLEAIYKHIKDNLNKKQNPLSKVLDRTKEYII